MPTTMFRSSMSTVLMYIFLASHGTDGASLHSGALNLPWQDELCCDSPLTHFGMKGGGASSPQTNRFVADLPHHSHCNFRNFTTESQLPQKPSGGFCLDIRCQIDKTWTNLTCDLRPHGQPSGHLAVTLQRLSEKNAEVNKSDNPVVCEAEVSFTCSLTIEPATGFVAMVTASISNEVAPSVLLIIPARPVKPSPPVNVSDFVTTKPELLVHWKDPPDHKTGQLRYEAQCSSINGSVWQLTFAPGERNLSLDLKPQEVYTVQVRCSSLVEPPVWSEWSEPHSFSLDTVSYTPKKVVAQPGEDVTVYCIFNDRSKNASSAKWNLNNQLLPSSQYRPFNDRVSQITVRASESRMYDKLKCIPGWQRHYSQIFVDGLFVDIRCETNGDKNAMECNWKNWAYPPLERLKFQSKWANLPCDEMEKRERDGENVGKLGPSCLETNSNDNTCKIQPLKQCHKLWLEMSTLLGTITSKPIYLAPRYHVKPDKPTNVSAVTQRSRLLKVTWNKPVKGVECQLRYHALATVWEDWKVLSPVQDPWVKVEIPHMCSVYVVQVRCIPINRRGYWSEWSDSKRSTAQNSGVPERGPDFWRIREDDPYRNSSNITLLFKDIPVSGNLFCVDGFRVCHQSSDGYVLTEKIRLGSSYRFEWDQDPQTVTVEAYNSLGSSINNVNMTLKKQPKRRCLRSFHVSIINSTCVSLSWTLLEESSAPLSMVVEWSLQGQQNSGLSKPRWARLSHASSPAYLRDDFFSSEYRFYLYPVFVDGEGEPMSTLATSCDPAAVMMLTLIIFLCVALLVTLVLSHNQMKKVVWKEVPNPKQCSWAKELDFKKVDTFDLFKSQRGLQAWPLTSENISKVIIADTTQSKPLMHSPLVSPTAHPANALAASLLPVIDFNIDGKTTFGGAPFLATSPDALILSSQGIDELQPLVDQHPGSTDTSVQSSVTYAKVLQADLKEDKHPVGHQYEGESGSNSNTEDVFFANSSDASECLPIGLWELDSCHSSDMDDPRHFSSCNSMEELSETSDQEHDGEERKETQLNYLRVQFTAEDGEREEEETETELLKKDVLDREDCFVEMHPLLGLEDSSEPRDLLSASTGGFSALYLPQCKTAPYMRQLITQAQDNKPQL